MQADVSIQLVLASLIVVLLIVVYLIRQRIKFISLRRGSVIEAVNFELGQAVLLLDPLTRTLNRSSIEEILGKEINRAQRQQATLFFLYIDVNDFKQVNTRFGHLTGDLVLAEVGSLLKQCVRGCDYVIRIGGDEFLVALVDTNASGAQIVKSRINQRTDVWSAHSPVPKLTLSLSIGIQEFSGEQSFDETLAAADAKMYAEKKTPQEIRSTRSWQ
jgi:diguanylate cyclase (GGDEF)-like protein